MVIVMKAVSSKTNSKAKGNTPGPTVMNTLEASSQTAVKGKERWSNSEAESPTKEAGKMIKDKGRGHRNTKTANSKVFS
jgi:hypothetical protein